MPERSGGNGNFTEIDTTGDTAVGQAVLGKNPVHAAFAGSTSRIIVSNKTDNNLTVYPTFSPQSFIPVTISLPPASQPVFTYATSTSRAYVALSGTNSLGVIDLSTNMLQASVPLTVGVFTGTTPVAVGSNSDGSRIFVVNKGSNNVSVVDSVAATVLSTIPVGTSPTWVQGNADNSLLYVLNTGSNDVTVIDTASSTVKATVPVGTAPNFASFNIKQRRVWVTNPGSNTVSSIDADPASPTFNTATSIAVGTQPMSVAPLPDGSRTYVANFGSNDVWIINNLNGLIERKISMVPSSNLAVLPHPISIAASGDSTKVVVADRDADDIVVIRTSDDTITTRIVPVQDCHTLAASPCYMPSFVIATP